jgi:uncharacterized membrane protein SpoIIM required for sporulation
LGFIFSARNFLYCLAVFLLAIPLGIGTSYAAPWFADAYVRFIINRVLSTLVTPAGTPVGIREVLIVFANNLVPVLIGFFSPFLLAEYNVRYAMRYRDRYMRAPKSTHARSRLYSELYENLTLLSLAITFAIGFFVFGIFTASLWQHGGVTLLERGLIEIAPHAPFETVALLLSSSTALCVRDRLLIALNSDQDAVHKAMNTLKQVRTVRNVVSSLMIPVLLLALSAIVEVYVSGKLARWV